MLYVYTAETADAAEIAAVQRVPLLAATLTLLLRASIRTLASAARNAAGAGRHVARDTRRRRVSLRQDHPEGRRNMRYVTEYLPENHLTEYVLTPKSFLRLR